MTWTELWVSWRLREWSTRERGQLLPRGRALAPGFGGIVFGDG
jgi:hypothetical protein